MKASYTLKRVLNERLYIKSLRITLKYCSRCVNKGTFQMESFSALLAICAGNSSDTGEFPSQSPVTRSFGVFFDLRLNKQLRKQSRRRWFETPLRSYYVTVLCFGNALRLKLTDQPQPGHTDGPNFRIPPVSCRETSLDLASVHSH